MKKTGSTAAACRAGGKMISSGKKLTALCVLEILKKYSDAQNLLTYTDIKDKLYAVYGIECERKSIAANIAALADFGYEIIKRAGGGCYLGARTFERAEIAFLIDTVFTSKNIPGKYAKELAEKLSAELSVYARQNYKYIYRAEELARTANKEVFLNIEIIAEAIETQKKVQFAYNRCAADGSLKPRRDRPYTVNPYFMINGHGKYFLVYNLEGRADISNYKLDLITDIKLLDEGLTPRKIDVKKYADEIVYMFGGDKTVTAVLKLGEERDAAHVLEWFSKKRGFTLKTASILRRLARRNVP